MFHVDCFRSGRSGLYEEPFMPSPIVCHYPAPDFTPPPAPIDAPVGGPVELPTGGPEDDTLKGGQGQAEGSDTPQPTSGTVDQGQPGNDSFRDQGDAPPPVEQTEAVEPENAAEEKAPATVPIGENLIVNGSFENHGDLNRGSWGTLTA